MTAQTHEALVESLANQIKGVSAIGGQTLDEFVEVMLVSYPRVIIDEAIAESGVNNIVIS